MDILLANFPDEPDIEGMEEAVRERESISTPESNSRPVGRVDKASQSTAPQLNSGEHDRAITNSKITSPSAPSNCLVHNDRSCIKSNCHLPCHRTTSGELPHGEGVISSTSPCHPQPDIPTALSHLSATSDSENDIQIRYVPGSLNLSDTASAGDMPKCHNLQGICGRAKYECVHSDQVVHCDQEFLDGLCNSLKIVAMLWIRSNQSPDESDPPIKEGSEDNEESEIDPVAYRFDANRVLKVILPEILRLNFCPELFSDNRIREQFLQDIVRVGDWLMRYDQMNIEFYAAAECYKASLQKFDDMEVKNAPWHSWCRQLPLKKDNPIIREQSNLALYPFSAQLLPTQGILIAEYWRKEQEEIISQIVKSSPDPSCAEKLRPSYTVLTEDTRILKGLGVIVKQLTLMPTMDEMTVKRFAFGAQDPLAEMARFMAELGEDEPLRRTQGGMFLGTFLSAQGKENLALEGSEDPYEAMEKYCG